MARGRPTDPEVMAQVAAALLAGMEQAEATRKFNLPPRTVARIAANLGPKLAEVGSRRLDAIGDMLVNLNEPSSVNHVHDGQANRHRVANFFQGQTIVAVRRSRK